jgi:NAD(P)H-dependent flavin oxidoreductase YrpB (nitropropane dioxygenase family)
MASTDSMSAAWTEQIIDISIKHRVGFLANALGTPPPWMLERAREAGIPVGALVGTKRHALAQVEAGLDFVVAQGAEAGGHTGTVGTMVIVPEIVSAVKQLRDMPVLAAGGIATGRQIAAAMALGADGAWTGSVWLTTRESEVSEHVKHKMVGAVSSDTVRSRHRTGKPSRQLRSSWHDAWSREGSPAPLPMPLMGYVSEPPLRRADVLADEGHAGAQQLSSYWVGQAVGLMNELHSCQEVMEEFVADYARAVKAMAVTLDFPSPSVGSQ